MIAATLVVIVIVIVLLFNNQTRLHEEKTRVHGVALARALSGAEYSQLVPETGESSLMRSLVNVQGNENFAYAIVINPAGKKLYEITSGGSITPVATMPTSIFQFRNESERRVLNLSN